MAYFQEKEDGNSRRVSNYNYGRRSESLAERIRRLENKSRLEERSEETKKKTKQFRFPFKWNKKFSQTKKKENQEKMLVIFFNKKNEIELPKFMPIYDGNMVIWKNKPYEFDPRAIWKIKGIRGTPQVYALKEIDRRPIKNKYDKWVYRDAAISNMDIEEIRARGDSTESDEFLIKAAIKAQTVKDQKKKIGTAVIVIIVIAIVGLILWFFLKGGGTTPAG